MIRITTIVAIALVAAPTAFAQSSCILSCMTTSLSSGGCTALGASATPNPVATNSPITPAPGTSIPPVIPVSSTDAPLTTPANPVSQEPSTPESPGSTETSTSTANGIYNAAGTGDVVAGVYPWDSRISYSPEGAWQATTSESSIGNRHNGTRVATIAGATITFPFEGKRITTLICNGSKGGDYSVQMDGAPAADLNGYKDPNVGGDECILASTFDSGSLEDGSHTISIIVKGSNVANAGGGTAVEFGGFIYLGPHAFGTDQGSKPNITAIVGGTVGGVVGGILIITLIIVIVIQKRRNRILDDAPAVYNIPASEATPYSGVPVTGYHDPYTLSGYGPSPYPNAMSGSTQPAPVWRQTNEGPFGSGTFVTGH
ncbi:hypothetical protein M408DRAFT_323423 [Serendipita vermifera MAFF 305830]|uniref:Uncharacterized protein n=1 Tax=Serendipita vermifera MAFF 305830 TaxID=933852 RepID=A0A0C3B1F2_SERVB|nr:hypothetical protein M408DRAFT_323423 [Serendipita vermifera MAFF 305830]